MRLALLLLFVLTACTSGSPDAPGPTADTTPTATGGGGGNGGGGGGGGNGDDTSDGTTPLTVAEFCASWARARWAYRTACFGSDLYPPGDPALRADEATCLLAAGEVAAGRLIYDADDARSCLVAIADAPCAGLEPAPTACALLASTVALGGACYPDATSSPVVDGDACLLGYCRTDGTCPGQCTAYRAAGQRCVEGEQRFACNPATSWCQEATERCTALRTEGASCVPGACAAGLACVGEGAEATCAPRALPGEACSSARPCTPAPYVCVGDRCVFRVGVGDPCVTSGSCRDGLDCVDPDGDGPTRAACTAPGGEGAVCEARGGCDAAHYCDLDAETGVGTCAPRNPVGSVCSASTACVAEAWCGAHATLGRACRPRGAAGEACFDGHAPADDPLACAAGLFCTTAGTCAPPGELGEPCRVGEPDSCVRGLWCGPSSATCLVPSGPAGPCVDGDADSCEGGLACACTADDPGCLTPEAPLACAPPRAPGTSCWRDSACRDGLCDRCPGGVCTEDGSGVCADLTPPEACLP